MKQLPTRVGHASSLSIADEWATKMVTPLKRFLLGMVLVASLAVVGASGRAQTATNSQPADPIGQQLDTKDPTQIQQAVTTILNLLQSSNADDRTNAVQGLAQKGHWLAKLRDAQQCEAIIQLAQVATLKVPFDGWSVEYVQDYRARALLASGRPREALAVAKALLNVARMKNVAADIAFIVDCLKAAYPGNEAMVDRFRQEQVAGSVFTNQLSPEALLSASAPRSSILDAVTVDGSDYVAAIQQYTSSTNYSGFVSLGNLLLLSDRPADAQPVFMLAYGLAGTNELVEATESIARCIKAQDGTIGRANAWLMSLPTATGP